MPSLRPLVRHFPRPAGAASTKSPYLVSMIAAPSNSMQSTGIQQQQQQQQQQQITRSFTSSAIRPSGNDTHYEPPGGWLFGVPPGEKYKKEGWENIWVWGFWGSLAVGVVAYAYKPDTSIQTWALEEARRRLEAEGILPDPQAKN